MMKLKRFFFGWMMEPPTPRTHKDNAVFLNAVILNSEELFDRLGAQEEDFRNRMIEYFRGKSGEETHAAISKMYNYCVTHYPTIADTLQNLMRSAQESASVDGVATDEEIVNLREKWMRRLINQPSDSESSEAESTKAGKSGYIALPIFFATNREILGGHVRRFYGTSRAEKVSYGCAWISLPDSLNYGNSDNSIWRFSQHRKGAARNKIVHLTTVPLMEDKCMVKLSKMMASLGEKEAILFVHGYNTTMANACQRMAQVAYTGNFRGPAFVFSWPSNQSVASYTADEGNVMWAIADFLHTLKLLLTKMGMEKLHILAHSMGSRAAIYSLLRLFPAELPEGSAKIGRIVLAAPDFDLAEFTHLVPDLAERCERITLYCSSDDQALHLSRSVHGGYPRLGDFRGFLETAADPRVGLMVSKHVDAIDTTGTDSSWLRHAYIFTTCGIIMDCCMVLRGGLSPDQRGSLLLKRLPSGHIYWSFATNQSGTTCLFTSGLLKMGLSFGVKRSNSQAVFPKAPSGGSVAVIEEGTDDSKERLLVTAEEKAQEAAGEMATSNRESKVECAQESGSLPEMTPGVDMFGGGPDVVDRSAQEDASAQMLSRSVSRKFMQEFASGLTFPSEEGILEVEDTTVEDIGGNDCCNLTVQDGKVPTRSGHHGHMTRSGSLQPAWKREVPEKALRMKFTSFRLDRGLGAGSKRADKRGHNHSLDISKLSGLGQVGAVSGESDAEVALTKGVVSLDRSFANASGDQVVDIRKVPEVPKGIPLPVKKVDIAPPVERTRAAA